MMEKKETLELVIEQLEERIAPGVCGCECDTKNNNGFGNGPESGPAPGNSGDSPRFGADFNNNYTPDENTNGRFGPR